MKKYQTTHDSRRSQKNKQKLTQQLSEKYIQDMTDELLKILKLDKSIWRDIDPYLFILAFTHKSGKSLIPKKIREIQETDYGSNDYEFFELMGDRVLDMIILNIILQLKHIETVGDATYVKQEVVRNTTLECFMNKKGLCQKIIKADTKFDGKICADVFEALLGVLYYWGFYVKGLKYCVLDDIKHWLIDNWNIHETIINLLEYGETQCESNK